MTKQVDVGLTDSKYMIVLDHNTLLYSDELKAVFHMHGSNRLMESQLPRGKTHYTYIHLNSTMHIYVEDFRHNVKRSQYEKC